MASCLMANSIWSRRSEALIPVPLRTTSISNFDLSEIVPAIPSHLGRRGHRNPIHAAWARPLAWGSHSPCSWPPQPLDRTLARDRLCDCFARNICVLQLRRAVCVGPTLFRSVDTYCAVVVSPSAGGLVIHSAPAGWTDSPASGASRFCIRLRLHGIATANLVARNDWRRTRSFWFGDRARSTVRQSSRHLRPGMVQCRKDTRCALFPDPMAG
jgi:hypothetical protein